ncbi:MAG: RHS repeat protein [Bryobacteraceae bacterium]|nr:RHS repeat protein [Bryobacteraceae bacterium]
MSWDAALNLTAVSGPNNATSAFAYDAASRYVSSTDPDGATSSNTYSVATRTNYSWTGKRFTRTTFDGLGRAEKVETGYAPTPGNYVVESVAETQYAPCACTPLGKMWRVSQPRKPVDPAVWTSYTYDELGRVKTITLPPNTGTSGNSGVTHYEYVLNTVKVIDPAGRWKKYAMDGFGNLASVEEPKPAGGGSYVTSYTYTMFGELATVTMTRDGFNGQTPLQVTQTRSFEYGAGKLAKTTFPETPGSTEYMYSGEQLMQKKNYKGTWKYFYNANRQMVRVEKYPGSGFTEDLNGRVTYYNDTHPFSTRACSH